MSTFLYLFVRRTKTVFFNTNCASECFLWNCILKYFQKECYSSNYFRYLTSMQLVQFVLVFTHANVPLFHDCDFPKVFSWVILGHGALFFVLFSNFYIQSYTKKSSKKISSDPKITTNGAQTNGVQTNGDVKKENWLYSWLFLVWKM